MPNGDGAKVPVWMLIAALLGGPAAGGGTAKLVSSWQDTSQIDQALDRCFRRTARLQWRVQRLEERLPSEPYPRMP